MGLLTLRCTCFLLGTRKVPDPLQRPGEVSGTGSTRLHKGDDITGLGLFLGLGPF